MADPVLNPVFGVGNYPPGQTTTVGASAQTSSFGIGNYPLGQTTMVGQQAKHTVLRDYRHAARIFTDDNLRLSPKYGFLFYVEFDFNPLITNVSNRATQELGMIVKSASLPKFTIDTKIHNAYNRKNIVQNKINYDQINISFHDDQSDTVRQFWYDYYSYFYRDPDYADSTYSAPHKYQSRPSFDWGYTPRPSVGYNQSAGVQPYQYIQAIRIYSMYQQNFSEYELINPIITSFKHGDHANSGETGFLEHQMSIQFETVKYQTGYVTRNTVGGFIDLHYDSTESPNGTDFGKGERAPHSYPDKIIDLANQNTTMNPYINVGLAATSQPLTAAFGGALRLSISGAAGTPGNSGGFSIPSLGSVYQGVPSQTAIAQQLQARATALIGATAGSLANGVVGGIANGLGSNGRSLIGLAASAIANPQGTLRTLENAAIGYASGLVTNYVTGKVSELTTEVSGKISEFIGENITQPVSAAFGDASQYISNQYYDTFGSATGALSSAEIENLGDAADF